MERFVGSLLFIVFSLILIALPSGNAATLEYNFNITWVTANPDGMQTRPVIGINNKWPIDPIVATRGDTVTVHVTNQLGNETTSLHWHGIFMNGSTHMDGPTGVTQCEIPNGATFTYNYTLEQVGTYWFHSHSKGQYPDGLRAPLIVRDPQDPFKDLYDEEIILSFSDWYHDLMKPLIADFISVSNPTGAEPVPKSALMNETQNLKYSVQPGKTYKFRMVNMAAFAAMYVWFEGHDMRIIEVDGVYTEPKSANLIYMTAAQRYSILVTTKNTTDANFPIIASMDEDLFDAVPDGLNPNVTGWLVYDQKKDNPAPALLDAFEPFDDFTLVPHEPESLYEKPGQTITLDLKMDNLGDGANYAFFNDITYVGPKVPSLYTALTSGDLATNAAIYGGNTNSFVLNEGEVVEVVINNDDPGKHPFHLHGHTFQLAYRSDDEAGFYTPNVTLASSPMRRDTVLVRPNGNVVLRFKATNPGIWLLHCHLEWHMVSGLAMTFIEAPLALQKKLPMSSIPADHFAACAKNEPPTPTSGNAAGNTADLLNLDGEPGPPDPLPAGFTARGIVALVFSIVSAFLGMAVIAWYGAMPLGDQKGANGHAGSAGAVSNGVGEGNGVNDTGVEGKGHGAS